MSVHTVEVRPQDALPIQKELEEFFRRLLYLPLMQTIAKIFPQVKFNASAADEYYLMQKIQQGDVIYDGAYFLGRFNARISKTIRELGGEWDALKKGFKLSPGKLTYDLKVAINASEQRLKKLNEGLQTILLEIEPRVEDSVDDLDLSKGIERVIAGLQTQTIKAMDAVGVKYTLTATQKEALKKDYNDNIKIYIKNWAQEKIESLRNVVTENAMAGYRATELIDKLQKDYGTTKAKAKFLARQETSLFMSKFRRERFIQAGVNYYKWVTVGDGKVRPGHKELNQRIFKFGDPPVVDSATGDRKEPGEDYNCRCRAVPVMGRVEKVGTEWKKV